MKKATLKSPPKEELTAIECPGPPGRNAIAEICASL